MLRQICGVAALLGCVAAAQPAYAIPIAAVTSFTNPSVFGSQDNSLGFRFSTSEDLTVSALGYYDEFLNGLNASHSVGIFTTGGALVASATVDGGSFLLGDFRYTNLLAPLALAAGTYHIAGTTLGDDGWVFQASNIVTEPRVTYVQSYFVSGTGGVLAFNDTLAVGREYMTVNFLSDENAAAVPEPATLLLLGTGLGVAAVRRRIKNRA